MFIIPRKKEQKHCSRMGFSDCVVALEFVQLHNVYILLCQQISSDKWERERETTKRWQVVFLTKSTWCAQRTLFHSIPTTKGTLQIKMRNKMQDSFETRKKRWIGMMEYRLEKGANNSHICLISELENRWKSFDMRHWHIFVAYSINYSGATVS